MSCQALVVSGFLGAGKTTLVRRLLADAQRRGVRAAVVSNEFGELGIDRALLARPGESYVEIEGGCVCCRLSDELVATLMFEIPDAELRARVLAGLGGVEETVTLEIGSETITATAEEDVDRTTADGKASSVQFIHFPLTADQKAAFQNSANRITVGIGHTNYGHMAIIPDAMRQELSRDLS